MATIGCGDCSGPTQLTAMDVELVEDGSVFVLNRYPPFVRVFDSGGAAVNTAVSRGEGPGEVGTPGRIYLNADGSFALHDGNPPRFVRFDSTGSSLRVTPHPRGLPISTAYDESSQTLYLVMSALGNPEPVLHKVRLGRSPAATELLDVDEFPASESGGRVRATEFAVAVSQHGTIALGNRFSYQIRTLDQSGERIAEFGRRLDRPLKSEEELADEARRFPRRDADPAKAHFGNCALVFDEQDNLWVLTEHGDPGETRFDVFSRTGAYMRSVTVEAPTFPGSLPAFDVRNGKLALIMADDNGNTLVKLFKLPLP